MYTKIIQNAKFVYILYTKIVQIKILYDNECTKNVHTKNVCFLYIQTMCKVYKTHTTSKLKRPLHVFCTYTQCTNYTKCMQMLIESYMRLLMYVFCI